MAVSPDQSLHYAKASGDWAAFHVDRAAARAAGFPDIILHGLCSMATCARGVADVVADGDSALLRRVAVRFSAPAHPSAALTVDVFDAGLTEAGSASYAFEARSAETLVLSHGRVELWPSASPARPAMGRRGLPPTATCSSCRWCHASAVDRTGNDRPAHLPCSPALLTRFAHPPRSVTSAERLILVASVRGIDATTSMDLGTL